MIKEELLTSHLDRRAYIQATYVEDGLLREDVNITEDVGWRQKWRSTKTHDMCHSLTLPDRLMRPPVEVKQICLEVPDGIKIKVQHPHQFFLTDGKH